MKLSIKDATKIMSGQLILGDPKIIATSACIDSRNVDPGCLFFAFKGANVDGHNFAAAASQQGAAGLVVTDLDWLKNDASISAAVIRVSEPIEALRLLGRSVRNGFKGPVVGITGSNGKTTTKQMVASVLQALGPGLSTVGNFNSQIGLPLMLARASSEHKWMVLEMGASAPGNISALADIAHPTVGIITSIGPAHLETFGSIERIAETKWELLDSLPSDGCAILPWNEPHLERHIRSFKKKIIFFGDNSSCPVRASAVEAAEHTRFMLHIGSESQPVQLAVPGRHNVMNALAAAAAGWSLGCSLPQIAEGLESFEPPKMRMQVLKLPTGATLVNDAYNANPASMVTAVRSLAETYPSKKKILVIGSMLELGEESDKYHFHLGVELAHFALERVILVGNETKSVLEGATSAGASAKKFSFHANSESVADEVRQAMSADSVVLFKGSRGIHLEKAVDALVGAN